MLKKLHNTLTSSPHRPPAFAPAYGGRAHGEFLRFSLCKAPSGTSFIKVGSHQGSLLSAVSGHSATEASGLLSLSKGSGPFKWVPIEYKLETFKRSNQDTIYTQKPSVFEGDWVQSGELLTDCASSVGGELALGQNLLIAYMPWEGYNFEDAILISERLVIDDLYTSVHIERYEIETHKTKYGNEEITRDIPDVSEKQIEHLDSSGVVKLGSWVEEGDILVGKITPMNKKAISPYQKLLYTILEKQVRPFRDTSLRAPKGIKAKVIDIKYFVNTEGVKPPRKELSKNQKLTPPSKQLDGRSFTSSFARGASLKKSFSPPRRGGDPEGGGVKSPLKAKTTRPSRRDPGCEAPGPLAVSFFRKISSFSNERIFENPKILSQLNPSSGAHVTTPTESGTSYGEHFLLRKFLLKLNKFYSSVSFKRKFNHKKSSYRQEILFCKKTGIKPPCYEAPLGSPYGPKGGLWPKKVSILKNLETIHIYLAEKRKIQVGDKMAGRHGNKGIVSQILPIIDMPYLPDGTPIDMVLNPLGVPSRMNVGQIYECLLGFAGKYLGENYKVIAFDEVYGPEASRSFVFNKLYEARRKTGLKWLFDPSSPGKMRIYDGRTGDCFDQTVTVGHAYIIRLVHMVDDKIHMRSTGPYSLVTQQPLRGRSKQGGQRLGEMEVWAIEGYGAAFTLLEMLTIKSDDMTGRMTLWSNLILNKEISIGTPESFKVLICELQALCMDIGLFRYNKSNDNFYSGDIDRGDTPQAFNQKNLNTLTEINNLISLP